MVEGIVVANYLAAARADLARSALWLAVDTDADAGEFAARTDPTTAVPAAPARTDAAAA